MGWREMVCQVELWQYRKARMLDWRKAQALETMPKLRELLEPRFKPFDEEVNQVPVRELVWVIAKA